MIGGIEIADHLPKHVTTTECIEEPRRRQSLAARGVDNEGLRADAQGKADTQWVDLQLADEALNYSNQNSQINVQILMI